MEHVISFSVKQLCAEISSFLCFQLRSSRTKKIIDDVDFATLSTFIEILFCWRYKKVFISFFFLLHKSKEKFYFLIELCYIINVFITQLFSTRKVFVEKHWKPKTAPNHVRLKGGSFFLWKTLSPYLESPTLVNDYFAGEQRKKRRN